MLLGSLLNARHAGIALVKKRSCFNWPKPRQIFLEAAQNPVWVSLTLGS